MTTTPSQAALLEAAKQVIRYWNDAQFPVSGEKVEADLRAAIYAAEAEHRTLYQKMRDAGYIARPMPSRDPDQEAEQSASVPTIHALIEECRDALAEELSAWDIEPPLHHVKQAHDRCVEWLASKG